MATEVDSISAIKELVKQGEGYTILQSVAAYREIVLGALSATRVVSPPMFRSLVICVSPNKALSLAARELARLARVQIQELVRVGQWNIIQAPT